MGSVGAMQAIKTLFKSAFLGAFLMAFAGFCFGGVAALFIWPGSNLGPPFGAIYGLGIGLVAGAIGGLALGVVRLQRRSSAEHREKNGSQY